MPRLKRAVAAAACAIGLTTAAIATAPPAAAVPYDCGEIEYSVAGATLSLEGDLSAVILPTTPPTSVTVELQWNGGASVSGLAGTVVGGIIIASKTGGWTYSPFPNRVIIQPLNLTCNWP